MSAPLILHIIWRLAPGGMENGLVNLINHLPRDCCRHAVLALDEITDFSKRIEREDVLLAAFHKPPGHGARLYARLRELIRQWQPSLVHTRGLAALEMAPLARWMGLPVIHGEHGWDAHDPGGVRQKYRLLRRLYRPFVTHYIAVSHAIEEYLVNAVGVAPGDVTCIPNGVDAARFFPAPEREAIRGSPFNSPALQVVGTVMRLSRVKDPLGLLTAFGLAVRAVPTLRLVVVGGGELTDTLRAAVVAGGLKHKVWLAGASNEVAAMMRGFDVFVLPSRAEGMSNTVLEAMACGLPVIATEVGANREVVAQGRTGELVPPGEPAKLAQAMVAMAENTARARQMGLAGRERVMKEFSLEAMVRGYEAVYRRVLAGGVLQRAS